MEAVFDRMTSLVDKSLVRQEEQADGTLRYRLLEILCEFGWACLRQHGEAPAVQHRHAEYYLALIEEANRYLEGAEQAQWLDRLEREHNNLRAALRWATTHQAIHLGLRLGAALPAFWIRRGYQKEGYERLTALVAQWAGLAPISPMEDILFYLGMFAVYRSEIQAARTYFEQSAEVSRTLDNRYRLSYAVELLGSLADDQGDYAAADTAHEEALQLSYQVGDDWGIAISLSHQGRKLASRGHLVEGRQSSEQAR